MSSLKSSVSQKRVAGLRNSKKERLIVVGGTEVTSIQKKFKKKFPPNAATSIMLQRSIMELHRSVPYRVERVIPPNMPDAALELERREMPVWPYIQAWNHFSVCLCAAYMTTLICLQDSPELTRHGGTGKRRKKRDRALHAFAKAAKISGDAAL